MDSFIKLYENVKRVMQADPMVSEIGYQRWVSTIEPLKFENQTAYLIAENEFIKTTVEDYYKDVFLKAFEEVMGFSVKVVFLLKEEEEKGDGFHEIERQMASLMASHRKSDYDLTFENFIKGKSNELAYAYCIAVSGKNVVIIRI